MANRKLVRLDCSTKEIWKLFQNSLPDEINPVYKENKAHNCSSCHHFFKNMANVVAIDEEKYETRGKASGRVFHLGDPVKVRVLRANLEQKVLDYEWVEE